MKFGKNGGSPLDLCIRKNLLNDKMFYLDTTTCKCGQIKCVITLCTNEDTEVNLSEQL